MLNSGETRAIQKFISRAETMMEFTYVERGLDYDERYVNNE